MDEFLKALAAFQPPAAKPIEFRVYYDTETGKILNYTNEDLPGQYILVDKDTFARHRFDCCVKDGKLKQYRLPATKMVPADDGTSCHPTDITIIVDDKQKSVKWKLKAYEQD